MDLSALSEEFNSEKFYTEVLSKEGREDRFVMSNGLFGLIKKALDTTESGNVNDSPGASHKPSRPGGTFGIAIRNTSRLIA